MDTSVGSSIYLIKNCGISENANIYYSVRVSGTLPNTAHCFVDGSIGTISCSNLISLREATGTGAYLILNNITITNLLTNGNYVSISSGASLLASNINTSGFDTAYYVPNTGTGPTLNITSNVSGTGTYDINILNSGTTGSFVGNADLSKISCVADDVTFQFLQSTGMVIVGNMFIGDTVTNVMDMTKSLKYATNLGVFSGGVASNSGLDVTITAGTGYLISGTIPNDIVHYIEWIEQTTTVASNSLSYIYIDSTGTLNNNTSKPNEQLNIIICSVYTGASDVIYYQNIETAGTYTATNQEYTIRDALGPIVASGLIATASATALKIDVSSG